MKLVFISTYPPRKCGIGTFTENLVKSVVSERDKSNVVEEPIIIALNEDKAEYDYPGEVKFVIRANHQKDYIQAARFINFSGADVCVLQHEFGIYGGEMGVFILPLISRLQIPLVVTFHTVLKNPSYVQRSIVQEIAKKADKVTVMSNLAVSFLKDIYKTTSQKIELIEHGVPDFDPLPQQQLKAKYGFPSRRIILTFGLIGRNKGIETVLHTLPKIIKEHPDVLYIILGKTHPGVVKISGEEYREYLKMLVKKYHLENHVYFHDHFVSEEVLFEYLSLSDIYITPYLSEEQITSGTLMYAIGAGSCVISTPYWHAKELLDKERGILFGFKNYEQLAGILNDLLSHPEKLEKYRKKAAEYGKKITWQRIGRHYLNLYNRIAKVPHVKEPSKNFAIDLTLMPTLKLDHILFLTDDTGIVKYAKYGLPIFKEGYNISDNSRALLMTTMYYRQRKDREIIGLMSRYLSYIHYMQNADGSFRNTLNYDRSYRDELGTEDAFGRSMWALGYLISHKPSDSFKQLGKELFIKSAEQLSYLTSIRGIANSIIGLCYFLREYSEREDVTQKLKVLVSKLKQYFLSHSSKQWQWFEDKLTYDNAVIPLALLHSYEILEDEEVLDIVTNSMAFLESVTMKGDYYTPVGNKKWYSPGREFPKFNQQSSEAMGMILLYYQAYKQFRKKRYLHSLFNTYLWYLGENDHGIPLYDHESGGCYDGLIYKGVNKNQGADSTLSYLISHLTVLQAHEKEHFI
ncbi:MAG: glycosyltransferase family 4 protein [Bacteroidales bacterium]